MIHFYSDKKNSQEMIKMMDLLRAQYRKCSTIYLSWDAASWHISQDLAIHVKQRNDAAQAEGYPVVKTAPLPAGAQFLNVIESVFSGMARGIIHNSDYDSVDADANGGIASGKQQKGKRGDSCGALLLTRKLDPETLISFRSAMSHYV
jgi:hypothetical protein